MRKLLGYKFHILAFLISILVLSRFLFDTDLGWHLAMGNWFLDRGEFIKVDPFSWTVPGYAWFHNYSFYQVFVAFLFRKLGFTALAVLFGLIPSLGVLIMLPKRISWQLLISVFFGVLLVSAFAGIRPHMVDFFLFSVLLVLLEKRAFEKKFLVPFWFLLFLVWANFHGGYFIGFLAFAAFSLVSSLFGKMEGKAINWIVVFAAIVAGYFGSLITPLGINFGHAVFFEYGLFHAWLNIAEFQPAVIIFPHDVFFALTGVIFLILVIKTDLSKNFPMLSLGFVLFVLPFLLGFLLVFWVSYFIFISARYFDFKFIFKWKWEMLPAALCLIAVVLGFFSYILTSNKLDGGFEGKDYYPKEALEFMVKTHLTDGLFNQFGWGGYIDLYYPQIKVFIDGRMTGWVRSDGVSMLSQYTSIVGGKCEVLDKYDVKIVLMQKNFKNICFANWNQVYADNIAVVLVKP
ncbi:MAG TPA: hypothetical protein VLE91_02240 [Candidatus Saccharimonadales bacterium]|nr:hypothetical protein [Candidatus Saccharimonadales bacterium]